MFAFVIFAMLISLTQCIVLDADNACDIVKADLTTMLASFAGKGSPILLYLDAQGCKNFQAASRSAYLHSYEYTGAKAIEDFTKTPLAIADEIMVYKESLPYAYFRELNLMLAVAKKEVEVFDNLKTRINEQLHQKHLAPWLGQANEKGYEVPKVGRDLSKWAIDCTQRFLEKFGSEHLDFKNQRDLLPLFKTQVYGNIPVASRLLKLDAIIATIASEGFPKLDPIELVVIVRTYLKGPSYPQNLPGVLSMDRNLVRYNECSSQLPMLGNGRLTGHCLKVRRHLKSLAENIRRHELVAAPAVVIFGMMIFVFSTLHLGLKAQYWPYGSDVFVVKEPHPMEYYLEIGYSLNSAVFWSNTDISHNFDVIAYHVTKKFVVTPTATICLLAAVIFQVKRKVATILREKEVKALLDDHQ